MNANDFYSRDKLSRIQQKEIVMEVKETREPSSGVRSIAKIRTTVLVIAIMLILFLVSMYLLQLSVL